VVGQRVVRFVAMVGVAAAASVGVVAISESAVPLPVTAQPASGESHVRPGYGPPRREYNGYGCVAVPVPVLTPARQPCASTYMRHSKFGPDASTARPS
jgi:hypothetical protein